jgi:hypothetical protein
MQATSLVRHTTGLVALLALSSCTATLEPADPDERRRGPDASVYIPDAKICPSYGTSAEISYPLDGATNVASPVPIRWRTEIPNTLDGRGIYLTETASGDVVPLAQWTASCSGTDGAWTTSCYTLAPNTTYTWHVWITCYDPSGPHEIATTTFTTAP